MTNKLLSFMLILFICMLFIGCTSTHRDTYVSALEAEHALREVAKLASQSVDVNLFSDLQLEDLLPQDATHFSEMNEIPLFLDHLDRWKDQVQQAFRSVVVQSTILIEENIQAVVWENPQATLLQGDRSATRELTKQQGEALRTQLTQRLRDALQTSDTTWQMILDRYGIWQKGTSLWGEDVLVEVTTDPFEHLSILFMNTYFEELGRQEELLRTTPVPRGSGSFLELFQQDA
ncbi:MAG: hypothetical protein ACQ5SW_07740 [Sphaerochaetaceae bacterium]